MTGNIQELAVSGKNFLANNSRVKQCFVMVHKQEKNERLRKVLSAEIEEAKKKDPESPKIYRTLVFVELKRHAKLLSLFLTQAGIPSTFIDGDMSQGLREIALKEFGEYRCPVLVTTDICALGINIKDIDHVINFDLPEELSTYAHRVGYIGRHKEGAATTSFYDPEVNYGLLKKLIKFIRDTDQEVPHWLLDFSADPNQASDCD